MKKIPPPASKLASHSYWHDYFKQDLPQHINIITILNLTVLTQTHGWAWRATWIHSFWQTHRNGIEIFNATFRYKGVNQNVFFPCIIPEEPLRHSGRIYSRAAKLISWLTQEEFLNQDINLNLVRQLIYNVNNYNMCRNFVLITRSVSTCQSGLPKWVIKKMTASW